MSAPSTETKACPAPTRRLAGWLPAGMLDWPGRLSATIFLGGCDFRCPFCHNTTLLTAPAAPVSWEQLANHLLEKRGWLDGVVITGGEPTLDPDLPHMLDFFAEMQMPVKLDTNGNHPDVLADVLAAGRVAYVALDIKTTFERYEALTGVAESGDNVARSVDLIIGSGVPHEFRTTAYPGAVMLDDIADIARSLEGGDRYAVQQFVPTTTLDPRASSVLPYRPDALHDTAALCNRFLPTVVRGA